MRLSQSRAIVFCAHANRPRTGFLAKVAQVVWHPPVDELHSIENKGSKTSNLFLDSFSDCGTTHSFFEMFQSFPGWW
jgi:hypothetical protein